MTLAIGERLLLIQHCSFPRRDCVKVTLETSIFDEDIVVVVVNLNLQELDFLSATIQPFWSWFDLLFQTTSLVSYPTEPA